MGAIGGLLGLNGGVQGTGANLTPGVTPGQLNTAYGGAQGALGSQQALLQALQGQGALGNQSQVYNQLQGVVNGTGPNPAQAQLAQATGQNVANQAALMAGQRGAGANVGLLARQAAQQGANTQQQAVGQAANLQANQSLNALGQAGNIANTQAANQIGATEANTQANLAQQQQLQNANSAMNQNQTAIATEGMKGQQSAVGGVLGGLGHVLGLADGGGVPAKEGPMSYLGRALAGGSSSAAPQNALQQGMQSFIGGVANQLRSTPAPLTSGLQMPQVGSSLVVAAPTLGVNTALSGPGTMPAGPSLGRYQLASGGDVGKKLKSGGKVPGNAKVPGNSPVNDNVSAMLSPGEGVIDRETMGHPGVVGDAARFVMAYVNSKKGKQ